MCFYKVILLFSGVPDGINKKLKIQNEDNRKRYYKERNRIPEGFQIFFLHLVPQWKDT
jgi:hypothetical protein